MRELSVFDAVGPVMIGPSSSHTAGALRIALLSGRIARERVVKAKFTLYGSFASTYTGHGTDRALVAGILGYDTMDPRVPHSLEDAREAGLEFSFVPNTTDRPDHPNTVEIEMTTADGAITLVQGVSVGGGEVRLTGINGVAVTLTGERPTLFIVQNDVPGVAARITETLAKAGVNIAFMHIYQAEKGKTAYTLIETDQKPDDAVCRQLQEDDNIRRVAVVW